MIEDYDNIVKAIRNYYKGSRDTPYKITSYKYINSTKAQIEVWYKGTTKVGPEEYDCYDETNTFIWEDKKLRRVK